MRKVPGLQLGVILAIAGVAIFFLFQAARQRQILQQIIERLTADSRIAEVLVTGVRVDPRTQKAYTTIKFVEYDTRLNPLPPKYFTFSANIIQFQSIVIRFDDFYVKKAHPLRGKSAYLFMKVFALTGKGAEVFDINKIQEVPLGYRVSNAHNDFEERLWQKFWRYALEPKDAKKMGIKNAQIEAPGTKFIPGMLYTIKIEHDGGLRIDAQPLPHILKGEKVYY